MKLGHAPPAIPFPPARPAIRMAGVFSGTMRSGIRRVFCRNLTLRMRLDADVAVTIRRRVSGAWTDAVYAGRDTQHLLSRIDPLGEDFQIVVNGAASGVVELI